MPFEDRFDEVIKKHGCSKSELARAMSIPQSTFLYKAKKLSAWNVVEFNRLITTLRLTDEGVDFLTAEVE